MTLLICSNPSACKKSEEQALALLTAMQLSSGAFPWFPGGREDLYMTLYVLDAFAEAQGFGVSIPEPLVKKAFEYLWHSKFSEIAGEESRVALTLYGAYVLSSYLDYSWAETARNTIKQWVTYADEHSPAMTAMGKASAAYVYQRLGDKTKSQAYLDQALDGAREDAVVGVYWTPEKMSWLWYSDTIETHAFLLKAVTDLRPTDKKLPGIAKWLLFNRKGNEWKSTRASAAAIYSLLGFMKSRGALDKSEVFHIQWDDLKTQVTIGPTEWLAKPLRWTRTGGKNPVKLEKNGPGIAYASLTTIFSTEDPPKPPPGNLIDLERRYFVRAVDGKTFKLKPLQTGATIKVGDQIEEQIVLKTRSQFEYLHIKSPKGAGFESESLTSGWKWEPLSVYEEPRDSLTNYFVNWAPHGEYHFRSHFRATTRGDFRIGPVTVQSIYAPEMASYSESFRFTVQ